MNPATGEGVPGYQGIKLGNSAYGPFSVQGGMLAAAESQGRVSEPFAGGTATRPSDEALHLLDLSTWEDLRMPLPGKGWVGPMELSSDGTLLAAAYHHYPQETLLVFDTVAGAQVGGRQLDFRPSLLAFTEDGSTLALYGQDLGERPGISEPAAPTVQLVDSATLEVLWEPELSGLRSGFWCTEGCDGRHDDMSFASWHPARVLSPDRGKLHVVHADDWRLTTIDFSARTVAGGELNTARSPLEWLLALFVGVAHAKGVETGALKEGVISPDGSRLYVFSRTIDINGSDTDPSIRTVEVERGRVVATHLLSSVGDLHSGGLSIAPDGSLVLSGGDWVELLDPATFEPLARLDWDEVVFGEDLGGRALVLASRRTNQQTELAVLDPGSFKVLRAWWPEGPARWVTP